VVGYCCGVVSCLQRHPGADSASQAPGRAPSCSCSGRRPTPGLWRRDRRPLIRGAGSGQVAERPVLRSPAGGARP
jgi:hypothetical protein